jgi:c-di-GMP-binding flagellar brake protein YcgR
MKESRKSIRVDAQLFISYDILDDKGKVVQAGMALSEDLSQSGVRIKDRSTFPIDTSIQIHLAVGEEVIDLSGTVRHVQKVSGSNYHIGVEFQELDEDTMMKLIQFYPNITTEKK